MTRFRNISNHRGRDTIVRSRCAPHVPSSACCGFTLIELLVVISIIALLIAILLPALAAARQTAIRIQCHSQVRQISLAFFMYADENQGFAPFDGNASGGDAESAAEVWWGRIARPYLNFERKNKWQVHPIEVCPNNPTDMAAASSNGTWWASNYGANGHYVTTTSSEYHDYPASLHKTLVPSKTLLLMDQKTRFARPNQWFPEPAFDQSHFHQDRANAIFADGHGAQLAESDVPRIHHTIMPGEVFWDPKSATSK